MRKDDWHLLTPEEKLESRFAEWLSTDSEKLSSQEVERIYQRRVRRYYDIIALRQPDRVPCIFNASGFVARYAGAGYSDFFYDYEKAQAGYEKFYDDFKVEYQVSGGFYCGRMLDILGCRSYSWPGGPLIGDRPFQFNEKEYMTADEYDALIESPEAFMLRTYMPRIFTSLKGLEMLPLFFNALELPFFPGLVSPFEGSSLQDALSALMEAGRESMKWFSIRGGIAARALNERGLPAIAGGFSKAPFDLIGDTMRGTRGIMLDMYRQPEKIIKACERMVPIAVKMAVLSVNKSRNPVALIALHKGADSFMSPDAFEKFYWPSLKAVILGMIGEGIVPSLFVEGAYNRRLDIIADSGLPKGKTIWYFEQTDMAQVKKKFGGWACIGGNVPASLFKTGTPRQMEDAVRRLIDTAAPGGGYFIAPGSIIDDAEPANVHAFLKTAREYGVYSSF